VTVSEPITRMRQPRRPGLETEDAALGVVIVNFRCADDTIECLESLLRSPLPMKIVVIENGSGDGSADKLRAWAAGQHKPVAAAEAMAMFSTPPVAKPVAMVELPATGSAAPFGAAAPLTLIVSEENRGFAGGNNLGLRHLSADRKLRHFWLLNNDTVVAPTAPGALLARMDATPGVGMCGTIVCHYWQPDKLQSLNGFSYNRYTGSSWGLGGNEPANSNFSPQDISDATDYVLGASLAISRPCLEALGPMAEDYFLYYEEIDWATRNRRRRERAFATAFAHGAVVFHKAGRAIGSGSPQASRSPFSEYWLTRSRLRFTWRFYPHLLPVHFLVSLGMIVRRLWRRRFANAKAVLRAQFGLRFQ